jgi:hypothetical protein
MATWRDLTSEAPQLAQDGRALLYQHGVGLAFLATTRPDGRPRLHPMCPILTDDELFAFIIPSPKQRDLRRDGSYAMHSFPCPDNEDAFAITGRAELVDDQALREALGQQFVAERVQLAVPLPATEDELFRFAIESCLLTRTTGHGDAAPRHTIWHDRSP